MSDLMLLGVLRMPLDMVLSDPLSTAQFHSKAQEAAALIEQQSKDIAALKSDIEAQIAIAKEAAGRAAGMERDAERYRYLKSRTRCFSLDMGGRHRYDPSSAFMRLQGPTLDDAFDAAIAKDKA